MDMKRWVALFRVVHMRILGVLWGRGVEERVVNVGMWGHRIVAGWMFMLVGVV